MYTKIYSDRDQQIKASADDGGGVVILDSYYLYIVACDDDGARVVYIRSIAQAHILPTSNTSDDIRVGN
jgi:hypothetical protein